MSAPKRPTIPVHALDQRDYREVLGHADVIVAVDVMTRRETVVHGMDLLRKAVDAGTTSEMSAAYVELDLQTSELELLRSIVQSIKGKSPGPGA